MWLTVTPMVSWTTILLGLFWIGTDAFQLAFQGHAEVVEDDPHKHLPMEELWRKLNGNRMRAANENIRKREGFMLLLIVFLVVARGVERFVTLGVREVGAMWHLT